MANELATEDALYIVGIGASAGGLEALESFFKNMPTDSGLAFVIVQHLSPDFKSLMDELLARYTNMAIYRVQDGVRVKPNAIYLIPPRQDMLLVDGKLRLTDHDLTERPHLSIDVFFRSLAHDAGSRAIAVVLSGTGSDGSRSLQDIKNASGLIVVQEAESAGFDGIPRSAIATGLADIICPPEEMPAKILHYVRHGTIPLTGDGDKVAGAAENEVSLILGVLRQHYRLDFSQYKLSTIKRRINRRLMMTSRPDIANYLDHLAGNPAERDNLYRDLLVEVTEFFRDPQAFAQIKDAIIPELVNQVKPNGELRIWVPGCATGEEAYSIAMLIQDYLNRANQSLAVKIFATDIHLQSLDIASAGRYSAEAVSNLPETYLAQFFQRDEEIFQIRKQLRQMIIFAPHNLLQDPPFTKMNLISCRNVLIYLQPQAQQNALSHFHFSLRTGSFLVLGPSEHLGKLKDEFVVVDQRWRLFKKRRDVRLTEIPISTRPIMERYSKPYNRFAPSNDWVEPLLAQFVPSGILVNEALEIVHIFGDGSRFLRHSPGKPTLNLLRMLAGDLQTAVRTALHRAAKESGPVVYAGIQTTIRDRQQHLKVSVTPVVGKKQGGLYYVIVLEPEQPPTPVIVDVEAFDAREASRDSISSLEQELQYTKEYLQTTIEELETTNEELQSTNEEMVAANEELQSTNEELHSVNEELYTVNAEHQRKIEELVQLTKDMQNLQRSSQIGVVFLNEQLEIREFTPAIADTFNLLPQDVGRPVEHFLYNIGLSRQNLQEMAQQVLLGNPAITREIETLEGRPFLLRVLPYISMADSIEGVVLTFNDLTEVKQMQSELAEAELQYRTLFENAPVSLWEGDFSAVKEFVVELSTTGVTDLDAYFTEHPEAVQECAELVKVIDVNKATLNLFDGNQKQDFRQGLSVVFAPESLSAFQAELVALARGAGSFTAETKRRTLQGRVINVNLRLAVVPGYEDTWARILISVTDITERLLAARKLAESEARYRRLSEELEERVAMRTAELAAANEKLQAETAALHHAQQALLESEARLALAVATTRLGIYEHAVPLDKNTYHSQEWAAILGYTLAELPPPETRLEWVGAQIHPDDVAHLDQAFTDFVEGRTPDYYVEVRMKHKSGHWIHCSGTSIATARNDQGHVTHILGSMQDITRYKEAEAAIQAFNEELEQRVAERTAALTAANARLRDEIEARKLAETFLRQSEEKFGEFVETAASGIIITDSNGHILLANEAAEELFGFPRDDLIGQPVEMLIPGQFHENHIKYRRDYAQNPKRRLMGQGELTGLHKSGRSFPLIIGLSAVTSGDETLIMCHISDLSEVKDAEQSLQEKAAELTRSNKELEEFAYVVSHDLRAPLRALISYSQFLQEDFQEALNEEGLEYLQGIADSSQRLDQLILDILSYSRVGRMDGDYTHVDTYKLLQEIVADLTLQEEADIQIPPDMPCVWGRETRLRQIFNNLLSNAIKYAQPDVPSSIHITWEAREDTVVFSVNDNGIGIAAKHFEKIFGVFQRLHTEEEYDGTGIGLAIVKKAVTQLGGDVWVESTPEKGATFSFTIPQSSPQDEPKT